RIDGIKEKPLLGWGFQVNSAKDKFQGPHIFNELEKGNTPLALLEEFGIPFGMLIIILFYYTFSTNRMHKRDRIKVVEVTRTDQQHVVTCKNSYR
ncbi:MAG: hypothetical protein HOJ18_12765, partial [Rhodospirillaceae bacterium]|nr:hypothetical protein [Rhodospirillaceae bacterium]